MYQWCAQTGWHVTLFTCIAFVYVVHLSCHDVSCSTWWYMHYLGDSGSYGDICLLPCLLGLHRASGYVLHLNVGHMWSSYMGYMVFCSAMSSCVHTVD